MKLSEILEKVDGKIGGIIMEGTGEVIEVEDDRVPNETDQEKKKGRKRFKSGRYVMTFQDPEVQLAQSNCGGAVWQLFLWLSGKVRFGNRISVRQQEISDALGVSQPYVSRAMKYLQDHGIIEKLGHGEWLMSSSIVWKGNKMDLAKEQERTASRHIAAQKKHDRKKNTKVAVKPVISKQPILSKATVSLDDIFDAPSPRPDDVVMNDDNYEDYDEPVDMTESINKFLEEQRHESETGWVCVESDHASVG
jgi:DNA-binding transcriptional ArsR family regulator